MSGGGASISSAIASSRPQRTVGRVRGADQVAGPTPDQRPTQALRRAITLDFGDVNPNADAGLGAQDRHKDVLPSGANMLKTYNYQDSKDHMGASMILFTKTFTKKIVCAAWYTTPEVMGMDVVKQLNSKHEDLGAEGSFTKRLPGFTWIGYDPTSICKGEKSTRKAAWICMPVSASGTSQAMTNVQTLGKDLLTSNFPMDLHIAELLISDDAAKKLNVKLGILQRTIKLDTTVEFSPYGDDGNTDS